MTGIAQSPASPTPHNAEGCLQAALHYRALGWFPLPCCVPVSATACNVQSHGPCAKPGQRPRVTWKAREAVSAEELRTWWRWWPRANVAVLTGKRSGYLLVLAIDPPHGGCASLAALEARYEPLPETVSHTTGSRGQHRLFTYPAGVPVGHAAGAKLGAGLDTRGEGGVILAPPSRHRSGARATWVDGRGPGEVALAPAPLWLVSLLTVTRPQGLQCGYGWGRVGASGPRILEGMRHIALFRIAAAMRDRGKRADTIVQELHRVNQARCTPPLDEPALAAIAASVQRYAPTFGGRILATRRGA